MSTHSTETQSPNPHDPLLQRYQEANAHDESRPGAALREAVLAHARAQAQVNAPAAPERAQRPAANDSQWAWRALGSFAVLGLVGLLVMQFDRGTPEEQQVALGAADQQSGRSATAPQAKASALVEATSGDAVGLNAAENESEAAATRPPATSRDALPAIAEASEPVSPAKPASPARALNTEAPEAMEPAEAFGKTAPAAGAEPPMVAESITRASPVPSLDAAPPIAQAQAPAPMARAPSAAPPLGPLNESPQRSKRETASESQFSNSTGMASDSAQAVLPPLHAAAAKGSLAAIQRLLAQGANIDAPDSLGRTALMLATMGRHKNLVEALMDAGADATLRDQAGLSAADHALRAGQADWLPLLQPRR